jgi:hypothetical protein
LRETPRSRRTPRDPLPPPDRRSLESRKPDNQIPCALILSRAAGHPQSACSANGSIGKSFPAECSLRSALSCSACGAHGVRDQRRRRSCRGCTRWAGDTGRESQLLVHVPKVKMACVDRNSTGKDRHDDPHCPEEEDLKFARRRHCDPRRSYQAV